MKMLFTSVRIRMGATKAALLAIALIIGACSNRDSRTTVTFWHFWSEPSQRAALDSLIEVFERENPTVDVQATVLSWADGKAKLQVAFNSGTAPDVVHLGGDWFAEFDSAPVFDDLPKTIGNGSRSAQWLVNARALVYDVRRSAGLPVGGLCVSDPHNVIKRVLPLLWLNGSRLYQRLPISGDLTDSLAESIWNVVTTSPTAIRDRSRQLDELLLRGEISSVLTGAWIVAMADKQNNSTLRVRPIPSILNSDVLALTRSSSSKSAALSLLAFLCRYDNARALCISVTDAGFPADLARASQDTVFTRDSLQRGFLRTAQMSFPLVHSAKLLSIEPIIEDMLERCYGAKSKEHVAAYVRSARDQVLRVESH
ncbi:MAG: extracellular solute-binding protein [Candidatus Kapabacteria bacterium]|nr:extracellular solute-binding protein [Candidatus Kapabacteria bacterium]